MEYVKKGLLQAARVAVIAAIPLLISAAQTGKFDLKFIGLSVFTAFIAGIDKFVHENPNLPQNGLLPF